MKNRVADGTRFSVKAAECVFEIKKRASNILLEVLCDFAQTNY